MAVRTATVITPAGISANPTTPTVSDTIHVSEIGRGVILEVVNGSGSPINVTILDGSRTPAGTAAVAATPVAVAASDRKRFLIQPSFAASDGYVTFTFSAVTSVTTELHRIPS